MGIRRTWSRGVAGALWLISLVTGPLQAADNQSADGGSLPDSTLSALVGTRQLTGCLVGPTEEIGQMLSLRGRAAIEIKGRGRDGDASGTMLDLAVYDRATARIVSYVCFTNASSRRSGEAIVSLAEVSSRGDRLVRAILPGSNLELESVRRHRTGESESIYYEARYASAAGEFSFLEPPVRLLLNATTGSLFRLNIDPDWLDPVAPPRVRISRKAAERIATVVLRRRDLAPAFGAGAVFGAVVAAEMYMVHPNDWLGFFKEYGEERARVAWVVPFRIEGGAAAGLHSLFVDAGSGILLGGLPAQSAVQLPR